MDQVYCFPFTEFGMGIFFYSFTLLYSLFLTIIFGVYSLLLFHMPMSLIRSLLQKFADNLGLPYKFF